MSTGFTWHPRAVNKVYNVKNKATEDVQNIVIEFLSVKDRTVQYSVGPDTSPLVAGTDRNYNIDLSGTTIVGLFWVRASGQGATTGTVYVSNEVLVYIDDPAVTLTVTNPYEIAIMKDGITVVDRGENTLYLPQNAGKVEVLFDDETVAVLSRQDITDIAAGNKQFSPQPIKISVQDEAITFNSKADMIEYLESLLPEAKVLIADKTQLTEDQIIQFYLPFYHYKYMRDGIVNVQYDSATMQLKLEKLVPKHGRLVDYFRAGGGGLGLAIATAIIIVVDWLLEKSTQESVKENADRVITSVEQSSKSISQQIEDTAVTIVQSTADTVWSIPKDQLIAKLKSIGANTRTEIGRIANEARAAVYGPKLPEPWWKNPVVVGLAGFAGGAIITKS